MRASDRVFVVGGILGLLLVASLPAEVLAQKPTKPAAPKAGPAAAPAPTVADLDSIVPKLASKNPDEVREAIDLLSVVDSPRVVPPLRDLLLAGQPDAITDRALEALGGIGSPDAVDVLERFTNHVRAGARRRAYQALAAIKAPRVRGLLERGLSDSDPSVRAASATALGNVGARDSVPVLFRAFAHGVFEAAASIGKLGDAKSVEKFTENLGSQPLSAMLAGYQAYLSRNDIPVTAKQSIVERLGEVSGPSVKHFLSEYLRNMPKGSPPKFRKQVEATMKRIPDKAPASQGKKPAPGAQTTKGGAK